MATTSLEDMPRLAARIAKNVHVVYDIGAHACRWTERHLSVFHKAHFYLFDAVRKYRPEVERHNKGVPEERFTYREGVLSAPGINDVNYYTKHNNPGSGGDSYYKEMTGRFDRVKPRSMPACTLDSLDLPPPQVMKLDTQGSELDILKGAQKALKTTLLIQIEMPLIRFNEGAPRFDAYLDVLGASGFVPYALEEIHTWPKKGITHIDLVFLSLKAIP